MAYADLLINWCTVLRFSQISVVIGSDGNDYYCIKAHTAAAADKPITGANYTTYWNPTGGFGVGLDWVLGTTYAASIDSYGQPVQDWLPVHALDDIPCRLMTTGGKEVTVGAEVVVADYKLFLGDVVITEQDRVVVLLASSIVIGTDGNEYVCILAHEAKAINKPITGANYATYWGAVGPGYGSAWLLGTAYVPAVTYEVLLVMDRQDGVASHHKECLMRVVR